VGVVRVEADPAITTAIDRALALTGWTCRDVSLGEVWDMATIQAGLLLVVEAWHSDKELMLAEPDGIGADVKARLSLGSSFDDATVRAAWDSQRGFTAQLAQVFEQVDVVVTPTLTIFPPRLDDGDDLLVSRCTLPPNLAGVPALSLPVPTGGPLPASMQLVGSAGSEERLLSMGAHLEAAVTG
jgi:Asp-tRNA(Asn)/Glu-tRNA(Gln) amidotransferase A subunit family amidase